MSSILPVDCEGLSVVILDDDPRIRALLKAQLSDFNVTAGFFDNAFDLLRDFER